jgi:hypothetical protein
MVLCASRLVTCGRRVCRRKNRLQREAENVITQMIYDVTIEVGHVDQWPLSWLHIVHVVTRISTVLIKTARAGATLQDLRAIA